MEEVSCNTSHLIQQASKIIVWYKNLNLEAASNHLVLWVGVHHTLLFN